MIREGHYTSKGLFSRLYHATKNSIRGVKLTYASEAAFRQEIFASIIMLTAVCFLGVGVIEKILLVATVLLVLIVELLNTAVECAVDKITTEHDPLIGMAKDAASAAVLISIILCVFTWAGIFIYRL